MRACGTGVPASTQHREPREPDERHPEPGKQATLDHQPVDQRLAGPARRGPELVPVPALESEPDVLYPVRHQVQPQELHRQERQRQPGDDRERHRQHLRDAGGNQEIDDVADVAIRDASLLDAVDDGREIVVAQHQVRGLARNVGAALAHCHAELALRSAGASFTPSPVTAT